MSEAPKPPPPPEDVTAFQFSGYAEGAVGSAIPNGVSFGPRLLARIIDTVAHTMVGLMTGLMMGIMVGISAAATGGDFQAIVRKMEASSPMDFVVGIAGFVAYHTILEGLHGSSLGKLLLGQVVVTDNLQPCGVGAAFIRSLAYFVDALFFGAIGYLEMQKTRLEKRHGDNWAHTFVARRIQVPISALRGTGRFVLVLLLALAVDSAIHMTWFVVKMM